MSDQNLTVSLAHFPFGDAENSTDWSSWLSHGSSNVTVKYPSRKYSVEYEPTGRSPGSVPPYRHSGTQPRILACWCSPPPLAPPPQALSARATRAINTPVANSALNLLMTIPLTTMLSLGDVDGPLLGARTRRWLVQKTSLSVGDRILQSALPSVFGPRSVCTENPKGGGVPSSWDQGPILLGKSCSS